MSGSAAEDEDAALQALCGSLGVDILHTEGMEAEINDWAARVKANQVQARALPQRARVEEVRMDPDFLRLTEKAWELRKSGDDCVGSDPAQAVRYYEWALDQLRPVPVKHAGPTRCALLLKLACCFLRADPLNDFTMDPARALRCCEQVKENDLHGAWKAEAQRLKEEAKVLLPKPEAGSHGHAANRIGNDGYAGPQQQNKIGVQSQTASAHRASSSLHQRSNNKTIYCLELNSVQTFNMLDTTLTDDMFFAMDAIKEDRMRRT